MAFQPYAPKKLEVYICDKMEGKLSTFFQLIKKAFMVLFKGKI